jgi:hypothetical protein
MGALLPPGSHSIAALTIGLLVLEKQESSLPLLVKRGMVIERAQVVWLRRKEAYLLL